jgi:hypothetical protein
MRKVLVVVATLAVLGVLATTASATRLRFSSQSFRMAAPELRFGGGLETRCPFTLEGTFHRTTFAKVEQTLLGYVTRARINEAACQEGTETVLQEKLPWHVTYEGFDGTLPNIMHVAVQLHGAAISLTKAGMMCLYQSTETRPWLLIFTREGGGNITEGTLANTFRLPRRSGSVFCPAEVEAAAIGPVTVLGNTTAISITLI